VIASIHANRDKRYKRVLSAVSKRSFTASIQSGPELKGISGRFVQLIGRVVGPRSRKPCKQELYFAGNDFQGLLYAMVVCDHLANVKGSNDTMRDALNVRAVILTFFADVRSIFDYMFLATLKSYQAKINKNKSAYGNRLRSQMKPRNAHFSSFLKELQQNEAEARKIFGDNLVDLWMKQCDWFDGFKQWRDDLTHNGHFLAVNPKNVDEFRIETLKKTKPFNQQSLPAKFIGGKNAISFACFSGLYAGLLFSVLNAWAEQLRKRLKLRLVKTHYAGRGGTVCDKNIKKALALL
jgi:hypothetical protein